jgi:glycerophosphoryl diester phosphodiesterase
MTERTITCASSLRARSATKDLSIFTSIMFEVVGLPADLRMVDLAEVARALSRFGKAVNVQVSLDADFEGFEALGLQAVGVDLEQHPDSEARLMTALDAFVARAKVQGLQTFAYGIRSLSLASAAVGAGVDFIAGDQEAPICRNLEQVYRFRLSELFGA